MNYNNDKKSVILPIAVAVSMIVGILLGATFFGKKTFISKSPGSNSIFKEVLMHINKSYVDDVSIDSLSTYGIEKNKYANLLVQNEVTMDDLFSDKK